MACRDAPAWESIDENWDGDSLEPTPGQLKLYDNFHSCELLVDGVHVCVRVPKRLLDGTCNVKWAPLHIRFPGGGFCTGHPFYPGWLHDHLHTLETSNDVVIIMPKYPLLPESIPCGSESFQLCGKFVKALPAILDEITTRNPSMKATLDLDRGLLVSGVSAGGVLAIYFWLLLKTRISVLLLEYPMLTPYERPSGLQYRGRTPTQEEVIQSATNILVDAVVGFGQWPERVGSYPPQGMSAAYMLSSTRIRVSVNKNVRILAPWELCWGPGILFPLEIFRRMLQSRGQAPPDLKHSGDTNTWEISVKSLVVAIGRKLLSRDKTQADIARTEKDILSAAGIALKKLGWEYVPSQEAIGCTLLEMHNFRAIYCPTIVICQGEEDTNTPPGFADNFVEVLRCLFSDTDISYWKVPKAAHGFLADAESKQPYHLHPKLKEAWEVLHLNPKDKYHKHLCYP